MLPVPYNSFPQIEGARDHKRVKEIFVNRTHSLKLKVLFQKLGKIFFFHFYSRKKRVENDFFYACLH